MTPTEIEQEIREIFAEHRKNDDRIAALVELVNELAQSATVHDTGIPGAIAGLVELAPGVLASVNGAGSIIEVELI